MKIEIETKFGVGEIVAVRGCNNRFLIQQVLTQTCPGGTQVCYEGYLIHGEYLEWSKSPDKFVGRGIENRPILLNEVLLSGIEYPEKPLKDSNA